MKSQPKSLAVILSTAAIVIIAGFAAIIAVLRGTVPATTPPLIEQKAVMSSSVCIALTGNNLQTCCEKELTEQGKLKSSCMGTWKISNDQCSWSCSSQ